MAHCLCLAVDRDQAGIVQNYIKSFFREIPDLARMVVRETQRGLELSNHVSISIATNSFGRCVVGRSCFAIFDECRLWRTRTSDGDA